MEERPIASCRDICRASSGLLGTTVVMCRGKGSRTSRVARNAIVAVIYARYFAVIYGSTAIAYEREREYSADIHAHMPARVRSRNYYDRYLYRQYAFHASMNNSEARAFQAIRGCLEYNAFVCNAVKRTQSGMEFLTKHAIYKCAFLVE